MEMTEEQILQEIARLFVDLGVATYGKEKANGAQRILSVAGAA